MHRKLEVLAPPRSTGSNCRAEDEAQVVAALLPTLVRQLFTLKDDPLSELPVAQLRVCVLLFEQPRSMSALSRELKISLSAMTQMADRLERVGLVQRVAEDNDRRVRLLQLTTRGQRALAARQEARRRSVAAAFAHLSPAARKKVVEAIQILTDACLASASCPNPKP